VLSREQFKERARISRAPCSDQRFAVVHTAEGEGFVFVAWTWVGTHLGEIGSVPPTGRELTMSGATVYFLTDGKVGGHWQVVDRLGVAKQLASTGS
jgi:predicted ester cyclase